MDPYKEIERLNKIIIDLHKTIADLKSRLDKLENPKNSRNSSIPPSHDYSRLLRTQSLREPSNKKRGGQPGHEGKTLEMTKNPDKIISHIPQFCTCCGLDLSQIKAELVECRQEVVLPVIQPVFIEHQSFQKICNCGNKVISVFPEGITPGISYGGNVESLIAYMNVRQFVPFTGWAKCSNLCLISL